MNATSTLPPGGQATASATRRTSLAPLLRGGGVLVPLLALLALAVAIELLRPGSFTLERLGLKSGEVMTLALAATGMTIVVLRGGIDLSIGGTISLATALAATSGEGPAALPWLLLIPLVGVAVGLANGFIISTLQLQPFLVTLAGWSILEGLALMVLPAEAPTVPSAWTAAVHSSIAGVPVPFVLLLGLLAWWFWFRGTRPMNGIRAAGSNERAAALMGVPPRRANLAAYGLSGLCAALAGLFYAAQTGAGDPVVGTDYILPAIAAVVIGGTSLAGGRGGLVGTLLGVIILNFIGDIVFLLRLPSYWQPVATGLILVAVVVATAAAAALSARTREASA